MKDECKYQCRKYQNLKETYTAEIVREAVSVGTGGGEECARIVGRSGICEHRRQRYHCKDCGREGANRGKTNVNINGNAINGREVYARIVGEAVSVSMGSREVYAKIVGEAVCVSMTTIEVNATIVGEAVSVSTEGRDITARIVGEKVQIEERQM